METEIDMEDNEFILFPEPNTTRLTCATPTTPNSNASSPLIMNEELSCSTQSYDEVRQSNSAESSLCSSSVMFDTKSCTKRGRPRKDFHAPMQRGTTKPLQRRKVVKDGQALGQFYADNCLNGNLDEKQNANIEESPHNQENFPGKMCFLCNLGERSSLGQGELMRYEFSENRLSSEEDLNECVDACILLDTEQQSSQFRRPKSQSNKLKVLNECHNELDKVGHSEILSLLDLIECGYVYVHSMCSSWTLGVRGNIEMNTNFVTVISKGLKQKCTFCNQYGASIQCRMSCNKIFHFPCAVAARCFLIRDIFRVFCAEHLNHVHLNCNDANIDCRQCSTSGDISTLIMCSTCGDHYHNSCVGLADLPDTRSGWNCANCVQCQICKQRDFAEGRSVKCEQCQKVYHSTCLRPVITSIPKYGWKCNRCRVCTDCGSRTPGAGTSSRWHCHYTICDSCYQQRNKGFSCPICHKAYRASAQKEMVKCSNCNRFVHSVCDDEADLTNYHNKKENNPDYDYFCPSCKTTFPYEFLTSGEITDGRSTSLSDIFHKDLETDLCEKSDSHIDFSKISKKRLAFKEYSRSRGGRASIQRGTMISQFVRKRGTRGKARHMLSIGSSSFSQTYDRSNRTIDDDMSMEKKIILCSMKDKFILSQDICVMCGSIGCNGDTYTISCAQCGQCYHPYCVNIKVSDVILQKGWRCLDCTVCEGCGLKNDESRLLLCDECDISFHIYCISPPLDSVPLGNWKCSWCAICHKCGKSASLNDSNWLNGYLECGVCSSQITCFVCLQKYENNDIIIECNMCNKWLHKCCDTTYNLKNKPNEFAEYNCIVCRSKDDTNFQQKQSAINDDSSIKSELSLALSSDVVKDADKSTGTCNEYSDNNGVLHSMDGVSVTETGLNMIKGLTTEIRRKRKIRLSNDFLSKKSDPLSSDSLMDNNKDLTDDKLTNMLLSPSENYKDGMIWIDMDKTPPDGFIITSSDDGKHILRKKRQRNLQKLGIGGFNVRNRANKKETDVHDSISHEVNTIESDKKKKNRKKLKWKLTESFPVYLQEAFFGKSLLSLNDTNVSLCESDSSGDNKNEVLSIFDITSKSNRESTETSKTLIETELEQKSQQKISESIDNIKTEICEEKMNPRNIFDNNIVQKSFRDSPTWNILHTKTGETNFNGQSISMESTLNPPTYVADIDRSITKFHNGDVQPIKQEQIQIGIMNQDQIKKMPTLSIMPSQKQDQTSEIKPTQFQFHETKNNDILLKDDRCFVPVKVVETATVGTQKTAEKMRIDEELGEMATISAVLYANTNIPELKEQYPNWSDRCKQILKKWRSLPTEKKAPFLQLAKDNRAALRSRKIKELDKIDIQKPEREQEQEKMWKQHKAKKEGLLNRVLLKVGLPDSTPVCSTNQTTFIKSEIESLNSDHKTNKYISDYSPINSVNNALQTEIRSVNNQISPDYGKHVQKSPLIYQSLYNSNLKASTNAFHGITPNSEFLLQNPKVMNVVQNHNSFNVNKSDLEMADNPDVPMPCEIDRLEPDENVGFGDILKGIGDGDDDDLLESLTTEVGDDFNILEYADPELDELVTNPNLLHKLDFGDGDKNT